MAIDKAARKVLRIKIGCPDNIRGLKSSLRSLRGEIDLEKVEPGRANIEAGPQLLGGRLRVLAAILEDGLVVGSKNYMLSKQASKSIRLRAIKIVKWLNLIT